MAALACLANSAQAAIQVPVGGVGPITFDANPANTEWSTLDNGGGGGAGGITTADALDQRVQTNVASAINVTLGTSGTTPPSANRIARQNTTRLNLQTCPTGVEYNSLLATLQNETGTDATELVITYDLGMENTAGTTLVEEIPGHRVFYSMTGEANSWVNIPELSTGTPGALVANVTLISPWAPGSMLYILWADDNASPGRNTSGNTEGAYQIDNVTFAASGVPLPPSLGILTPTNGQSFVQGSIATVTTRTTGRINSVDLRVDGADRENDATAPFTFTLDTSTLSLGTHTISGRANHDTGSVLSTNTVTINIVPNTAPYIAIATNQPTNNILVGTAFTNLVVATDDVAVVKVDWYVGANLVYTRSNSPWTFVYNDTLPGTNIIVRGVASDASGLTSSATNRLTVNNPPINYLLIVTNGSNWKYYASTNEPELLGGATPWYSPGYDWSAWSNAPMAEIGAGDSSPTPGDSFYPERTVIDIGTNTARYPTVYFVKEFDYLYDTDVLDVGLVFRLLRDDGAVVYLNGVPVWYNNMPAPPIGYSTLASAAAGDDGTVYQELILSYTDLQNLGGDFYFGPNLICVEVHQSSLTSSDLSFDFMLWGQTYSPPTIAITSPTNNQQIAQDATLPVNVTASTFVSQVDFYLDGLDFDNYLNTDFDRSAIAPNFSLDVLFNVAGVHTLYAVGTDVTGVTVTSAPVTVRVVFGGSDAVPFGGTWKYNDTGTDLGTDWKNSVYDDQNWASGPAPLGYPVGGIHGIVTVVSFGADGNNKYPTTYFRNSFSLPSLASVSNLTLTLRYDDGGVVYINGNEVYRVNLPTGTITYTNFTGAAVNTTNTICLSPSVLVQGNNVIAVEIHQANATSSDLQMDLQLKLNRPPSGPPTVAITSPTNGATFLAGDVVAIAASATDPDCGVAAVEFYDGATLISSDATAAYTASWIAVVGTHTLTAKVISTIGGSATTNVTVNVLPGPDYLTIVDSNSVWKYLDDGSNQGTTWVAPTFNDSAWASGPATLGYNDPFVVTTVGFGPDANNKFVTTYFRHAFNYDGAGGVTGMVVRLLVDDGAVVHLNGNELFRNNMPEGVVDYLTEAPATQAEGVFFTTNIPISSILVGQNVFAVEVHQEGVASSDLSFNLQLQAVGADIVAAPTLYYAYDSVAQTLSLSWTDAGYELVQANTLAGPWTRVSLTSPANVSTATGTKFYQLRKL